jgi:O-acetyl-ADP-ribose deacetylase (regulator of RNase III)
MISYHVGDVTLTDLPDPVVIAHIVNDAGRFGAGVSGAIAKRYPTARRGYLTWHADMNPMISRPCQLGENLWVPVGRDIGREAGDRWVVHMVAQRGTRTKAKPKPLDLDALDRCLHQLAGASFVVDTPIAMPRIGCGLAGGTWEEVEPLIKSHLGDLDVHVYDLPT